MEPLDRDTAKKLFEHYRKHRDGIRNKPEMAWVCLICGSVHIIPKPDERAQAGLSRLRICLLPLCLPGLRQDDRRARPEEPRVRRSAACGSAPAGPAVVQQDDRQQRRTL